MNIKKLRERAGMTQAALAEAMGTTQACIAMWETSATMPRADKLPELAKIFDCEISDLFKQEG